MTEIKLVHVRTTSKVDKLIDGFEGSVNQLLSEGWEYKETINWGNDFLIILVK
ncbi:MAG: hypothetical protein ACFFCS_00120 [Candidatus Hodarchaeota archaeon]